MLSNRRLTNISTPKQRDAVASVVSVGRTTASFGF